MVKALHVVAICLVALPLAGCSKAENGDPASGAASTAAADPATAVQAAVFQFQPGQYRSTVSIDKIEIPGLPAGAGERMKAMMEKSRSIEYCLSAEDAAKGTDAMKEHMAKGKCRFERFEASGGTVNSEMVCEGGQGASLRTTSSGTYTPTGAVVKGRGEMVGPAGRSMRIEETVTMERIADCP